MRGIRFFTLSAPRRFRGCRLAYPGAAAHLGGMVRKGPGSALEFAQAFCDLQIALRSAEEGRCRLDLSNPLDSARKTQAAMEEAREMLDAQVAEWGGEMRPGGLITENGALRILLEMEEETSRQLRARVSELELQLAEPPVVVADERLVLYRREDGTYADSPEPEVAILIFPSLAEVADRFKVRPLLPGCPA